MLGVGNALQHVLLTPNPENTEITKGSSISTGTDLPAVCKVEQYPFRRNLGSG